MTKKVKKRKNIYRVDFEITGSDFGFVYANSVLEAEDLIRDSEGDINVSAVKKVARKELRLGECIINP